MRAFEAKQAADKRSVTLHYEEFLADIKEASTKSGAYELSYYVDDLNESGIKKGALNIISSKLEEEGFYTEIISESYYEPETFIIEWDIVEDENSKAFEAKESADIKTAEQHYEKFKKAIEATAKNNAEYELIYDTSNLYDSGIKPGALEKIALMLCEEGYDTIIDYRTEIFIITWEFVEDDNSIGMPYFFD